jgi:hypothetical protein
MSNLRAAVRLRSLSGISLGTVAMVGVGMALYQLTSLELGPSARDFRVNLDLGTPWVQEVAQPLEVADAVVGQMSVVLRAQPFVIHSQTRARVAVVAPSSASTTAASPTRALPIIGPCQSPSTGLSSETQPSNGSAAGHTARPCSEAGEPD